MKEFLKIVGLIMLPSIMAAILMLLYMYLETHWVQYTHFIFNHEPSNFRVMQLSDIHISRCFVKFSKITHAISLYRPDCIVLTGDYIDDSADEGKFVHFLTELMTTGIPVVLVWGNHDAKAFRRLGSFENFRNRVKALGCNVLEDSLLHLEKNKVDYVLIGLNNLMQRDFNKDNIQAVFESADALSSKLNLPAKKIILTHNPDMIFQIAQWDFEVMLCGHFHGKQIYMPFQLENKYLRKEKLCTMGISRGYHVVENRKMIINRGLGNVLFPFRFLSRPEITVVDF